ncbi:exonuclease domain-containing protein [Streptomyces sp. RTd22]|uniref:exonuclease domain-containing protein n=1 Tax=Streptomyces sp. RTd22 TaxID=1841249 RepID=UPI0007C52E10|nr:exonuclease domain-containing protein [Streptomyces sp. RTd22]
MNQLPDTFLGFDLETTGVDVETDRIVTAAMVEVLHGVPRRSWTWLVNPGIPIPDGAAGVHGITTEKAQQDGMNPIRATAQIAGQLWGALSNGIPLVIMNAPFDLTLLDRECRRHDVTPISEMIASAMDAVILDPIVLDRHVDPFRPGKRTLESLAEYYRVTLNGAHEASADALAAVQVTQKILNCAEDERAWNRTTHHDQVHGHDMGELYGKQALWFAAWAAGYQDWLRRRKNPLAAVNASWPIIPVPQAVVDVA